MTMTMKAQETTLGTSPLVGSLLMGLARWNLGDLSRLPNGISIGPMFRIHEGVDFWPIPIRWLFGPTTTIVDGNIMCYNCQKSSCDWGCAPETTWESDTGPPDHLGNTPSPSRSTSLQILSKNSVIFLLICDIFVRSSRTSIYTHTRTKAKGTQSLGNVCYCTSDWPETSHTHILRDRVLKFVETRSPPQSGTMQNATPLN